VNLPPWMYGEVAAKLEATEERIRLELSHIVACMFGEACELILRNTAETRIDPGDQGDADVDGAAASDYSEVD
jgi:hypothetical protein